MEQQTLQKSHDELAGALAEFFDQMLRGHHLPTRAQWLRASSALRAAEPFITPSSVSITPRHAVVVADLIDEKVHGEMDRAEALRAGK